MTKQMQKKIIILAMFAGEIMMKNGAEIYRVEDTISRICKACRIPFVEVFVTPTGMFLSVDNGKDGEMMTYLKRIKGTKTDLGKISETNQFSRDFVATDLSVDEGMEWLKKISHSKPYPLWVRTLIGAISCACFSIMFDGSWADFSAAFLVGAASYLFSLCFDFLETNYFIKGFCCTAFATVSALICVSVGIGQSYGPVIIGALMLFVPGVAITNSIRDFLNGDMLSGLARMAEAFCIAVSLGAGAGIVLRTWIMLGGVLG